MTDVSLSSAEQDLLNQGLKCSAPLKPSSVLLDSFTSHIENIFNRCRLENFATITLETTNIIKSFLRHQTTKFGSSSSVIKSLLNKINVNNLLVTKAYKGNCTVIMRMSDYICKTEDFLNSTDFDRTPKDLIPGFLKKVNSTIKQNKDILQLFNFKIDWLISSVPVTPLLYSLPKIHKPGIPVRPIVSFVGTSAHGLSSFLGDVFQRHLDYRSEFSIKNSSELVHQIKDLKFPEGATMVSFDIVNLYPSTPPVEAAELINQLLAFSDLSDDVGSSLSALLKVCLEQNFFKFNNRFYIQKKTA
ncbi:uncharacterized protein LOC123318255 [Coccinella septempunctata]|uniref:uncharacterized protein LOC123318255 n=1 Tax=Coccinella septempunctata TaxID=41139 RepID=UPI001D0732C1|nr:uncharacterized protein LOC123318255 [Coccinella septempunctata]